MLQPRLQKVGPSSGSNPLQLSSEKQIRHFAVCGGEKELIFLLQGRSVVAFALMYYRKMEDLHRKG